MLKTTEEIKLTEYYKNKYPDLYIKYPDVYLNDSYIEFLLKNYNFLNNQNYIIDKEKNIDKFKNIF